MEIIFESRARLVVLQEISKTADMGFLCRLLEKRYGRVEAGEYGPDSKFQVWHSTDVVGEHAMLYQPALLAAALDCDTAALKVEYGLYNRAKTLSKAFRAATDWGRSGSGSGSGVKPRFDYTLQGATAARLPAVFFAHAGTEGGRSMTTGQCTRHSATSSAITFRSLSTLNLHAMFNYELGHKPRPILL